MSEAALPVSPYITPEGHRKLQAELETLWRQTRPEVTRALSAAAAEGDRSENAEYIYRKKQLREIDRRIRYLGKRLDVLRVVREPPHDRTKVYFGARVTVEDEQGETREFRIVGADESDPSLGDVSVDAPLSRALLGKQVDDEAVVRLPEGSKLWFVVEIEYA